jgi:sporulation protein YlmC with PRC-barrel domain
MKAKIMWASLLVLTLVLAACGDGGSDTDDNGGVEQVATPTTVTAAEPTATTAATPTTAAEITTVTQTETITETTSMTGTEGVTGSDAMTETEGAELTPTAEATVSATETATDTTGLTNGAGITGTDNLTGTGVTTTDQVRGVVRASELLGYGVQNAAGDDLGSINDAMISLQDGCIRYMILSFGGILGLGDNLYLIPWRAVTIDPIGERLIFNVEPDVLNDAPIFDVNNLPDFTSPDWDTEIHTYWDPIEVLSTDTTSSAADTTTTTGTTSPCIDAMTATGAATGTGATEAVTDTTTSDEGIAVETPQVMRLSELLSLDVTNSQGEDLGAIEDIMLDWRQDRIVYMILSFGGFLGLGEKWFVIPLEQVTLDPIEQRLIFDVEPERLETAPGYDANTLPDTTDPNWDEEIRNFWAENT